MTSKFSSRENVKVVIRYRPVNKMERAHENDDIKVEPMVLDEKQSNIILGKKKNKVWGFDGVCSAQTGQENMFAIVAEQTCRDVVNGYNGTIFVYGQTGSGKTYTMYGAEDKPDEMALMGIIPRSVSYIFDTIANEEDIETYRVTVSFLEIYQEKLRDLLNNAKGQDLKIRLNKRHETYVQGLVEHQVESISDVLQLIRIAVDNRVTDSTNMNAVSSRGHMLMRMTVVIKLKDGTIRIAAANFADLAGSEKVKKTGAIGQRLNEAKAINKSLSTLGRVINVLSSGKGKHVPFRDSMLTHVLRDSLGGNCKTTLVVTVSPHKYNRMETINSLRFGRRCKLVTNKASVNRVYSNDELMRRLAVLEAKNEELQEMLKQKAFEAFQNSHVPKQIENLEQELGELKDKLSKTEAENDTLDQVIKDLRTEGMELEVKFEGDKEQMEALQRKIKELETMVETLKDELDAYKQRERQMNNAHKLLEDRLTDMETENEERTNEINTLQNELTILRQFKHETQQQNIENMMMREQRNNEINQLKQQIEKQQMEFEQQLMSAENEGISVKKELSIEQKKMKQLLIEQEKMEKEKVILEQEYLKMEQELQVVDKVRRYSEVHRASNASDANDEKKAKELAKMDKEMIAKLEKSRIEQLEKYKLEYEEKEQKLHNEYQQKEEALKNNEERMRNEIKQGLTIQIKNETDVGFNKKMDESRKQFAAQLVALQQALNEAHDTSNNMRMEIEDERKKYKELQVRMDEKSKKMLGTENDKESMAQEMEQLRKELTEEQNQNENVNEREREYKEEINAYDEEKDKWLKEQERLQEELDEERSKIEQIKEDFQRKAELFGAKEKQHLNLLRQEKQRNQQMKGKLSEHKGMILKSTQLLGKANKLLKQRESKIYNLVEKQTMYLDSMNKLRDIQIGMDHDHAKKILDEEAEADQRRRQVLEEQRRKDEEYVRSLLLQEQKPAGGGGGGAGAGAGVPNPKRESQSIQNNMSNMSNMSTGRRKSQSRSSAHGHHSKKRSSGGSGVYHNNHQSNDVEQMMEFANKQSKTNLSQQIASVALAQQRDRLMGGKQKKSVLDLWIKSQMQLMCGQLPTICKKYGIQLNKLDDMYGSAKRNYQPEIDEKHYLKFRDANYDPKEFDTDDRKKSKRHAKNPSKHINPLLPEAVDNEIYDPYGHYNDNERGGMRVAAKPKGFVAQPFSPPLGALQSPSLSISRDDEKENLSPNKKKKSFGIFKRKSKDKKDKKSKKKSFKKGKGKKNKQYIEFEFEEEVAPPPVPFGQYLNNMDLQQFEKIKIAKNGNGNGVQVELEEEMNMDRQRYQKKELRPESVSSNDSLEYDPRSDHASPNSNGHQLVPTGDTMLVHDLSAHSSYSRDISISTMNTQIAIESKVVFEALTEFVKVGEMAGIAVSSQFGSINNKKNVGTPMLRLMMKNGNLNGSPINRINIKFNKNCVGLHSNLNNINVPNGSVLHTQTFQCNVPLMLNEMHSIRKQHFDFNATLVINTNLFAIKCVVSVPIHLFFQPKGQIPRDQFLQMWKSIPPSKESKLQIRKARSDDMEHLKSLLMIHKMFFIHHRNIPTKGNILYYSSKMYGQILLCELSIALSGKGTVVVRSNDSYKSLLAVNAVRFLIDTDSDFYNQ